MATKQPPFRIPINIKNGSNYRWMERKISDFSDGDLTKWPAPGSGYRNSAQEFYLCHLGQKWAERDGLTESGIHYYIDHLPVGYATFEIDQPTGHQVYKRLFGHPTGRFYDSVLKFEPHFLWLMSEMDGDCQCTLCGRKPLVPRPRPVQRHTQSSPKRQPQPQPESSSDENDDDELDNDENDKFNDEKDSEPERSEPVGTFEDILPVRRTQRKLKKSGEPFAQDEEGNEDIYKGCIRSLEVARGSSKAIEIDLVEEDSIDWQAERTLLPQYFAQIEQQHSFVPRIGELVLWCPNWPQDQYLMLDHDTMEYKFYSFKNRKFCGSPNWRGGVVATVPSSGSKHETLDFPDILDAPEKQSSLCNSGLRIETMTDPNEDCDKSLSKQYKHVPLRNIRPLTHWRILLRGKSVNQLHESITYALTCMTTLTLLEKTLFLGDWPNGSIFCRGLYLGSELITVGDTVRIRSNKTTGEGNEPTPTDVFVVSSIRYNLVEISWQHALPNTRTISGKSFITVVGHAYTLDSQRAYSVAKESATPAVGSTHNGSMSLQDIKGRFSSVGADQYGPWYPLHAPHQKLEVSHEQILGRLYEADAVRLWLGQRQNKGKTSIPKPSLGFDVDGIMAARVYASASDERLPDPENAGDVNWFLADTRAQALAISSLNGIEVGRYHDIRDEETLKYWRDAVRIADGRGMGVVATKDDGMVSWSDVPIRRRGRPAGSKVVNGKLVLPGQFSHGDQQPLHREELKSSSQMTDAALLSEHEDASYRSEDLQYDNARDIDSMDGIDKM